jgi:hypothetical protein
VDELVAKPILGSDGAASWQAFRKEIPSKVLHAQSVAPKAPLKKSDRLGTGFSSWEEERKHEQMVRKDAGHAEAGSGYTTFRKKNDAEEAAERKRKIQIEKRIRPDDKEYFIPAKTFEGWKFDYIFTTRVDRGGTGYYWDGHDGIKKLNGTLKGDPPSTTEEDGNHQEDSNASSDAPTRPKKKKRKKDKAPVFVSDPNNPMEQAQAIWERRNHMAAGVGGSSQTTPLPEGWQAAQDPASGKTYYFHRASGERSWEIPKQQAEASQGEDTKTQEKEEALLDGWKSAVDAKSGKTYYYSTSGETRWDKPT